MIILEKYFVTIIVLLNVSFAYASNNNDKIDDSTFVNDSAKTDGIRMIVFGGIGMATGGNWGWIDDNFNIGTSIDVGLEIPFTKSHIFAFELYNHLWMCSKKMDGYFDDYLKISDKFYSQGGLSTVIKVYLWSSRYDFRISLHLGAVLFSIVKNGSDYHAIDTGLGLYYRLSDEIILSLNRRIMIGEFDLGGGSRERTQNLIMFHICYKL